MDIAAQRLALEEAAWNTHDADQILEGYAETIEIRDGAAFINSLPEWRQFLQRKFQQQLDHKLKLDLWGALKGRMAVRFEAEWHDEKGQWYRSYGVQVFQFNEDGRAEKRFASQESVAITESDREL